MSRPGASETQPVTSIFRLIIVPVVAMMVALAFAVTWLTYTSGRDAVDRLVYARMSDTTQRAEAFIEAMVPACRGWQMIPPPAPAPARSPVNWSTRHCSAPPV
ncbi:MAG: hypothetical protein EXR28_17195 [Betaproteobacteria bacterium]|nr:hypothetical protein [Betaproteobacteria bacterium]